VKAPLPDNEPARLAALRRYSILDTEPERPFDRIAKLAAHALDVPIALVSFIDAERQWSKACIGSVQREVARDAAFAAHVIFDDRPLIVNDTLEDPRFRDNPLVAGAPHARFYAGAPLRSPSGLCIGSLCAIDTRPRTIGAGQVEALQDLADVAIGELELRVASYERRLAQRIVQTSPDVVYVLDLNSCRTTFASNGLEAALAAKQGKSDVLEHLIHPEDLPRAIAHYEAFKNVADDSRVEVVLRMRDRQGEYRWYLSHEAVFERDPHGTPLQVIGVASDVTAMKDIEQALSRSEESLRTQLRILHGVLESAGDGIVVADEHGELTIFNPAAERLLGAGDARPKPSDWAHTFGLLTPDGRTHFAADELPIARALGGEACDNVEMLVRNARVPGGVYVTVTGRPLFEGANVCGGVVTFTDVTKLKLAQSELTRLASLDGLTGVPNHRAFKERLAQLTAEAERGRKFTLVLCDLDHFKTLNDTFGHPVGDDVLVGVAQALRSQARATDLVARYGGEEFAVLYTDVGETLACTLVERLMRALDRVSSPLPVTASFGICEYSPLFKGDAHAMLAVADQALYRAKHEGRNRFVRAHDAAMH
jgi:diguanylate cyclase (GGDEF)-like protein